MTEFYARVIAVDLVHVFAICPHCGKVHMHGSNGDIHSEEYGDRVPHCIGEEYEFSPNYDLITDRDTIRSEQPVYVKQRKRDGHISIKKAKRGRC